MKFLSYTISWLQAILFGLAVFIVITVVFTITNRINNMKNDTEIKAGVVMFGDSITHLNDWTNVFPNQVVINSGHSGYTTRNLLRIANKKVVKYQPECCYVMMGINDLIQGKSMNKVTKNYKLLIEKLRENDIKVVVQSTLYTQYHQEINNSVDILNQFLKDYCDQIGIKFLDVNDKLCNDGFLPGKYSTDGLHLNHEAYLVWSEILKNN
ncbi:MAG: GDSL-type esterase/lipase family protein [Bacteroidales bacterium]|nr:GDSL-type esterase/lipase family protein [Bacteroidales bacterium]